MHAMYFRASFAFALLLACHGSFGQADEAQSEGTSLPDVCDPKVSRFEKHEQQVIFCYAGKFLVKLISEINGGEEKSVQHVRSHLLPYLGGTQTLEALKSDKADDAKCTVCYTDAGASEGLTSLRNSLPGEQLKAYDDLKVCYQILTERILRKLPTSPDGIMLIQHPFFKEVIPQLITLFRPLMMDFKFDASSCALNNKAGSKFFEKTQRISQRPGSGRLGIPPRTKLSLGGGAAGRMAFGAHGHLSAGAAGLRTGEGLPGRPFAGKGPKPPFDTEKLKERLDKLRAERAENVKSRDEKKPADEPEKKPADEPEKPADEPEKKPADEPEKKPAEEPENKPVEEPEKKAQDSEVKKEASEESEVKPQEHSDSKSWFG